MNKDMFTKDDLIRKSGIPDDLLASLIKEKLVRPAGIADDKTPLFSSDSLALAEHILKLKDMGYRPEEIYKIVKKIGLPKSAEDESASLRASQYLTVGELAEKAGISPRTIKHWEDKGIIDPDMRSEGGFRLYSETYIFLCQLIQGLQLFGYTLEEIKTISDHFRDFLTLQERMKEFAKPDVAAKLEAMLAVVQAFFDKMKLFREGMERWENLLKKKRKELLAMKAKNEKRNAKP